MGESLAVSLKKKWLNQVLTSNAGLQQLVGIRVLCSAGRSMDSRTSRAAFLRNHHFRRPLSSMMQRQTWNNIDFAYKMLQLQNWFFFFCSFEKCYKPNNPYVRLYTGTNTGLNLSTSSILMKHLFFIFCSVLVVWQYLIFLPVNEESNK